MVIDYIIRRFVESIGGTEIIYEIVSLTFIATVLFVFYKITT